MSAKIRNLAAAFAPIALRAMGATYQSASPQRRPYKKLPCTVAAIGRMPSTSALQHLQAKEPGEQLKDSNSSGNQPPAAAKTKESVVADSNLPMAVAPSLPPVPAKLVKQIQSGQYFELAMLLSDIEDLAGYPQIEDTQKPKVKHISTILEWLQCFTVYSWVITTSQPERAQDLLGYQAVIVDARMRYEGRGWLNYDRRFRQAAAADPIRKWSSLDSDLWHMCFTSLRRRSVWCQSCHLTTHSSAECIWAPGQQSLKLPATEAVSQSATPVCKSWNFSPNPDCAFQGCKFQHVCIYCCKDPTLTRQQIAHKGMFCRRRAQQDQQYQYQRFKPY